MTDGLTDKGGSGRSIKAFSDKFQKHCGKDNIDFPIDD